MLLEVNHNVSHPETRHADVLKRNTCRVQVSPSGSPLHHLFLRSDHLHTASIRQEDAFVLGETRAEREGGTHPSNPALIPPLRGTSRGFSLADSRDCGGERTRCFAHATPAE